MSEQESKKSFFLGLTIGIAVISTTAFFVLLGMGHSNDGKTDTSKTIDANTNQAAAVNTNQAAAQPTEPAADATKLRPVTKADHVRGDYNAPVTLIIFSDFQCPYCAKHEDTIKQVLADYPGKVRVVFRNYPLSFHDQAQKAAEATECADEQGKYWEMHDKVFEANNNGTMSVDQWKKDASDLGLDTAKFNDCLTSGKYADKIAADEAEGQSAGVSGTPGTFVNGELIKGAVPLENFKQIIDSQLK
jgi:protein-disulfide isomerase